MVDDHSRLAYAEVFQGKGENARQAVAFLRRGIRSRMHVTWMRAGLRATKRCASDRFLPGRPGKDKHYGGPTR
jgi:hypothetical protein